MYCTHCHMPSASPTRYHPLAQSLATNVIVKAAGAADAPKRYAVQGKLFFGSAMRFHTFFDVDNDPSEVVLELAEKPTE